MTKCHSLGDLNIGWRLEVQDLGIGSGVSPEASLFALRTAVFSWRPHTALPLGMCIPSVSLHVPISSSYKDASHIRLGLILRVSF